MYRCFVHSFCLLFCAALSLSTEQIITLRFTRINNMLSVTEQNKMVMFNTLKTTDKMFIRISQLDQYILYVGLVSVGYFTLSCQQL